MQTLSQEVRKQFKTHKLPKIYKNIEKFFTIFKIRKDDVIN